MLSPEPGGFQGDRDPVPPGTAVTQPSMFTGSVGTSLSLAPHWPARPALSLTTDTLSFLSFLPEEGPVP